jgi:exopolysaccharide biosynthesis protein
VCLLNGKIQGNPNSNGRAQRTFIGTNGNAGDIWLCVSDGRYNDGKSAGLNGYQCGAYLKSKGCTLGVPLDGGGSSTIWFNGEVLNAAKSGQRAVVDFLCFK